MTAPFRRTLAGILAALAAGCAAPSSDTKGRTMDAPLGSFPLTSASLYAFAATTDAARCRAFYEGKLGLKVINEDPYGLVFDSGGTMLRMQKGPEATPVPRTVVGWNVRDIEQAVKGLAGAGVTVERYSWFKQDETGIATFPDGSRVAWFKDPDGNILSLAQLPYLARR